MKLNSKNLVMRYNAQHIIPAIAKRYLSSPFHPIRPKIAHMYAHRDRNTLWWQVSIVQLLEYKGVVRSWSRRRARTAFRNALRKQGFDPDGKRTAEGLLRYERDLTGSLDIHPRPQSVLSSFEDVQRDADSLVERILRQWASGAKSASGEDATVSSKSDNP
ncbi:hypothetical protein N7474_002415 [Penicillium riverlandense]|uniref:uncharacterized protein n=1 Tax=Penicillium riverlandense TaxID=1903569 RepID=UPI002546D39A|nr:uncharacterized protein N7474_002415 [Penicillium riverlandense]KAJ5825277.1 hypothetical protein N7474_002415 [Penicillium riverlandense]